MGAMGAIAAVRPYPGRPHCYELVPEGHPSLVVHEDVIVRLELSVGTLLTQQLVAAIAHEQQVADLSAAALRLLEARSRSRRQLAAALTKKGGSACVIGEVLAQLEKLGLVDDEAFARDLAQSLLHRRVVGRQGLLYRLQQSGLTDEVACAAVALATEGVDETRRAMEALAPRLPDWQALTPAKRRSRAFHLLSRLGFDQDAIDDALTTALADE